MFDNLKCKFGFHKKAQRHWTESYKFRTNRKGRSRKKFYTEKIIFTETFCENCGKVLKTKSKWKRR